MKKILALIPTRLNSRRLPAKALLPINKSSNNSCLQKNYFVEKINEALYAVMIKLFLIAKNLELKL